MSENLKRFRVRYRTERGDFRNIHFHRASRDEAIFAAGSYIGDPECVFISATEVGSLRGDAEPVMMTEEKP
jgi:hypothetical protein